jgi:2,4-dienoyl-CoA reductase-like NADH-dependent reductase (Old Yellow Enzyme family)
MADACPGEMYTDSQVMQPRSTPRAMSETDIAHTVDEYAKSAQLAIEAGFDGVESQLRAAFQGLFILAGGFDRTSAEDALKAGHADLIAFARSFLANPDLVERMRTNETLNAVDMATFYTPGPKGYTDYPSRAA